MIKCKVLTDRQVKNVINHIIKGWPNQKIARSYKVDVNTIKRIQEYTMRNWSDLVGVCAFGKRSAYWESEKEIELSFNPQYSPEDLKGWEAEQYGKL